MAKSKNYTTDFSNRALEMIMRDVLSGMEECLLESAYKNSKDAGFEIIEIHPPRKSKKSSTATGETTTADAEVLDFPSKIRVCG